MTSKCVYRIAIHEGRVTVFPLITPFESRDVDDLATGEYACVHDLPKWVQERLAVLMMMSYTPPTEEVEGVGRRISRNVYWVFKPLHIA